MHKVHTQREEFVKFATLDAQNALAQLHIALLVHLEIICLMELAGVNVLESS